MPAIDLKQPICRTGINFLNQLKRVNQKEEGGESLGYLQKIGSQKNQFVETMIKILGY